MWLQGTTMNAGCTTDLAPHEHAVLFPTVARLDSANACWIVQVRGVLFEPGKVGIRKRFLLKMLLRAMRCGPEALESEIFRSRIDHFLADGVRGRKIAVRLGDRQFTLKGRSRRAGQFSGLIRVPCEEFSAEWGGGAAPTHIELQLPAEDGRSIAAPLYCLPATGESILSDIDDTIKLSQVESRAELLANTFLREFAPVEGMAEVFRAWAEQGAAFHYVSSSPWQLLEPLSALCSREGFPAGSIHLSHFRLRDHMLRKLLLVRPAYKYAAIKAILRLFPERRFVLVGDSGEYDPEIYGAVARKFPGRVSRILIRRLPGREIAGQRLRRAGRRLAPETWVLFDEAHELPRPVCV